MKRDVSKKILTHLFASIYLSYLLLYLITGYSPQWDLLYALSDSDFSGFATLAAHIDAG